MLPIREALKIFLWLISKEGFS
uniref:Uncharacterized protein n=1 Tax=Rhizophora mucronata TaxID=61149 RepID=A0A2P2NCW6_RHIMU